MRRRGSKTDRATKPSVCEQTVLGYVHMLMRMVVRVCAVMVRARLNWHKQKGKTIRDALEDICAGHAWRRLRIDGNALTVGWSAAWDFLVSYKRTRN